MIPAPIKVGYQLVISGREVEMKEISLIFVREMTVFELNESRVKLLDPITLLWWNIMILSSLFHLSFSTISNSFSIFGLERVKKTSLKPIQMHHFSTFLYIYQAIKFHIGWIGILDFPSFFSSIGIPSSSISFEIARFWGSVLAE